MKDKIKKISELLANNKRLSIGILIFLGVFVIALVSFLSKDTFANIEDTDSLSINCSDTVSKGGEVECSIVLNSVSISTQGITANYNVSEGMEFVSFTKVGNWNDYSDDSEDGSGNPNGFVLVKIAGVTGSSVIGTVKFKVPDAASSNEIYKVELVDATIGDGGTTSITFDEVYDEVRVLSDVNTLDSVSLGVGSLNEVFNKDNNEYTATINSDKVTINVTKSDSNSTVSGDINEVNLHYGTNELNIVVISESGIDNTYTFRIYRPYEFSSDVYKYDKIGKYIYTRDDILETTILSNITLPTELAADIENDRLIISYGDEKLLDIEIVNISFDKYNIVDNIIYVGKDLTYSDFMNSITLNGVRVYIFDNNDNQIVDGNMSNNYKLKVCYDTNYETPLLEEYVFNEEYLNINSDFINVDDTNKIFKRVVLNTVYSDLLGNISTSGSINVFDKDGNVVDRTSKVKTGDVIEIKLTNTTYKYTVSVLGDVNGDGEANMGDVGLLYRYLKGKTELENYQVSAGDTINTSSIKINDVSRIYRYHKGKVNTMEVE